ncbi:MAG: aminotransferase class I/II-fold pyridoxal phosphate-dependent enzyme [Patescibacteria group bacterium]|nr:aminotransferase class I/II-fold pyridoxal phosphate-dependent enzyme [Patescibacteria group bacterium]
MRPIAISLSPNAEKKDILLSLKLIFSPWVYVKGQSVKSLEQWFRNYFNVSYAVSFNSGRTAFYSILKALDIKKDDEVILQSFTCVAVPNSIIRTGAKPIYCDILADLTIDPKDIERKITKKTKAILVQHTFGIPSQMEEIAEIAKKHNLFVIEDCAHIIGGETSGRKLGKIGIASFFSFGRDKAFSSVFGGVSITNEKELGKKIRSFQSKLSYPSYFWVFQQLFHPVAFSFILPLYNFLSIGKVLLVLLQKLKLLSFPVSNEEKKGIFKNGSIRKMPNALCALALFQLKKLSEFNKKRLDFVSFYLSNIKNENFKPAYAQKYPLLRFPIVVGKRDEVLKQFRKKGIYLGNWYSNIIDPKEVNFKKLFYEKGSCPNAESISRKIINLPTYPLMGEKEAAKIVKILNNYNA